MNATTSMRKVLERHCPRCGAVQTEMFNGRVIWKPCNLHVPGPKAPPKAFWPNEVIIAEPEIPANE